MSKVIIHTNETTGAGASEVFRRVTSTHDAAGEKNSLDVAATVYGMTDAGARTNMKMTNEGHAEVAIHSPILPFGSVHAEPLTPVFQLDAVYGLNSFMVDTTTGRAIAGANSASVSASNNMFVCSTGTTSFSFATLQSRRRLRYRPGQGLVGRFAGYFSTPAASSYQLLGFGTAESGYYFGYSGTTFGILYVTGGVREVQTLTVTTASTATNNYVVTLPNGTAVTVTATNNGSTARTAYEISLGTFPGWDAMQRGSTVIFVANSAGPVSGTFSLAQTGAVTPAAGSVVETTAGVSSTDTFIPQTDWNGDKLDGTGASGVTLDPLKGNVYQLGVQYLGFGCVTFEIEVATANSNNPSFVVVHTFKHPNSLTAPHITQPSFPFSMIAYSAGSTTDLTVRAGSAAGFIEGQVKRTGPRMSYYRETNGFVGSAASTYYPLFTVRNDFTYQGKVNQSVVNLINISCSHDDATPVSFVLIRNATLGGTPNFTQYSSGISSTSWDTSATTATITTNDQLVFTSNLGSAFGGVFSFEDEIALQPGQSITLAARAVTGTATYVIASLNTREDQ